MRYRRQESFRYQFEEPVACTFRILKVESKERLSNTGNAYVYDISEGGVKLTTPLNLSIDNKKIEIEISFRLNEAELLLTGILVWKKNHINDYSYGVHFTIDEKLKRKLIEELKIFSRGIAFIKRK
ncbi:PilZ domain-containing protein [Bacillus sp. S/N-304-OC-R1]|uniref:PilZ domain-containing protein n=1 Tax=Bacillus sp. S/N-304-OC-R1 TaxID=2758034 RepID=UPI001C8D2424|nr:PilZ domain-containing protein [Bacillus sp. S/N-304-OC-R1]MBY0121777.1 PilZ domain-containing protein [Bacillus sp. S/N-304-OC-R1]